MMTLCTGCQFRPQRAAMSTTNGIILVAKLTEDKNRCIPCHFPLSFCLLAKELGEKSEWMSSRSKQRLPRLQQPSSSTVEIMGAGPTRCRLWTIYAAAPGGASANTTEAVGDGEEAVEHSTAWTSNNMHQPGQGSLPGASSFPLHKYEVGTITSCRVRSYGEWKLCGYESTENFPEPVAS
ncbi:hypothetical protein J3F83DRAFT_419342 [Trichoderma novae-zelandiae]